MDIIKKLKNIPSWANWVFLNADGVWYYSKYEPHYTDDGYWIVTGIKEIALCEDKISGHSMRKFQLQNGNFTELAQ